MLDYFNVSIKISRKAFHMFGNVAYSTVLWEGNYFLHSVNIFFFFWGGKGIVFSILVILGHNGIVEQIILFAGCLKSHCYLLLDFRGMPRTERNGVCSVSKAETS